MKREGNFNFVWKGLVIGLINTEMKTIYEIMFQNVRHTES